MAVEKRSRDLLGRAQVMRCPVCNDRNHVLNTMLAALVLSPQ